MNSEADPSDRLFTLRTVLILACCLAVIGLAGVLAYFTSSRADAPASPAPPPAAAQPIP
jgi:predicted ribosomally synthesized peptide with SipW-like signal peptide